ncbi:hypothetical protein JTB14_017025 [Gonioctena quinquepunctata]|nr:hypothetical protein JTB14_017025 [Gonioctena quinquepunctata]
MERAEHSVNNETTAVAQKTEEVRKGDIEDTISNISKHSEKQRGSRLSSSSEKNELGEAEKLWWKEVQNHCLPEALNRIGQNDDLEGSKLKNVSTYLDGEKILRVRGRISVDIPNFQNNPIILDGKHRRNFPPVEKQEFEKPESTETTFTNGVLILSGRTHLATHMEMTTRRPIILPPKHRLTKRIPQQCAHQGRYIHKLRHFNKKVEPGNLRCARKPNEKTKGLITSVFSKLGVTLSDGDIEDCHRLKSFPNPNNENRNPAKNVIVKFSSHFEENPVLESSNVQRGRSIKLRNVGFQGEGVFYMNDHLSSYFEIIHKESRQFCVLTTPSFAG